MKLKTLRGKVEEPQPSVYSSKKCYLIRYSDLITAGSAGNSVHIFNTF